MRKDAKVLFGVGGVLLAVLVVYFVSTSKKKVVTVAGTDKSAVTIPPEQATVPPAVSTDGTNTGNSNIAGPGPVEGPTQPPVTVTEPPKKVVPPEGVVPPEKPVTDQVKPDRTGDVGPVGPEVPAKPRTADSIYVVKANQTYGTISLERYGTAKHWVEIQKANPGVDPKRLQIGDKLNLPDLAVATKVDGTNIGPGFVGVIPLDQQSTILANETRMSSHQDAPADPAAPAGPAPAVGQVYHVRQGDSLYKISKLVYRSGKHADAIYEANKAAIGPDKARLKLNMPLTIPELAEAPRTTLSDAAH